MLLARTTKAIDTALATGSLPCARCGGQHALSMCPADASVGKKGVVWSEMGKGAHGAADEYLKKHPGYKYVPGAATGSGGKVAVGGKNWGGFKNSGAGNTPATKNNATNASAPGKFDKQQRGASGGFTRPTAGKQIGSRDSHVRGPEYFNSTPESDMYYPRKQDLSIADKKPNNNGKPWNLPKVLNDRAGIRDRLGSQFAIRQNFFPNTGDKKVLTNHFEYKIEACTTFYEYKILDLNMNNRKRARAIIKMAIAEWSFLAQNEDCFATNYFDTIVSWKPLHLNLGKGESNADDDNIEWGQRITVGNSILSVRFRFVKTIPIYDLERYAAGDPSYEGVVFDDVAACLNLVISKSFNTQVHKLSANKFFVKSARVPLRAGSTESDSLEIIRGYFYNVKPGMGNIILNFNLSTSAVFRPVIVADFLNYDNNTFGNTANTVLLGKSVYVDAKRHHPEPKRQESLNTEDDRYKKVSQLSQENIETLTFPKQRMLNGQLVFRPDGTADNEQVFVIDHLEQVFRQRPVPGRPAVNVGTHDRPVWYAQEHLRIVPYQPYTKTVPDKFTSSMVNEACRTPETSRAYIENEGLRSLGFSISNDVAAFKNIPMRLHPTMLQVPYTRLDFPRVLYRDPANREHAAQPASRWALPRSSGYKFYTTVSKTERFKYVIIATPGVDRTTPGYYEDQLMGHIGRCGLSHQQFTRISVDDVTPFLASNNESAFHKKLIEASKHGAKFAILVLEKHDKSMYGCLKNLADRVVGMQSICLVENFKNDDRFWGDLMTNIMMKLNIKLGGINHVVAAVQDRLKTHTMVLGADLVHPPSNLPGVPSIASIVGSVDNHAGKCLGSMRLQSIDKTDCEIIDYQTVVDMVTERLHAWADVHTGTSKLPANIIYYRDGVSAGHYPKVKEEELKAIHAAYAAVRKSKHLSPQPLNLTAVIVTKRHHTRFYPTKDGDKDKWGNNNCIPGTCVDKLVTSPYYQEFYLQSHSGIKGTARPTHYFVLENKIPGLTLEALRDLTHSISYSYVRSMTPVSYVSPTYYADRLCERGRLYIRKFIVGDDLAFKQQLDSHRSTVQARLRSAKKAKSDSLQSQKGDKSAEEKLKEMEDRNALKEEMKKWVFDKVKAEFYRAKEGAGKGGGDPGDVGDGNPWGRELGKTMFWM